MKHALSRTLLNCKLSQPSLWAKLNPMALLAPLSANAISLAFFRELRLITPRG